MQSRLGGTGFVAAGDNGRQRVQTKLVGRFNVSNVLGVLGVLLVYGAEWKTAVPVLAELLPPPGRMQAMGGEHAPLVVIDYAHTPDALEKGLDALRSVAEDRKGALWCVFGCGGDRDRGKRGEMGRMAEKADHVIVTSDNPRSEAPLEIMPLWRLARLTPCRGGTNEGGLKGCGSLGSWQPGAGGRCV